MSSASAARLTAEAGVTEIPMLIGSEWRTAARGPLFDPDMTEERMVRFNY
jgi:hypothetical protein